MKNAFDEGLPQISPQLQELLNAITAVPPNAAEAEQLLKRHCYRKEELSGLLPLLYIYHGSVTADAQNSAVLRLLLQHGADPEQTDAEGLSAYDKLEQALDAVKSYAEAEYLRSLWRIMQSEGPMPIFSGALAWTMPDFHDAYVAERTAIKKAEGISWFGRKKNTDHIKRRFTAENFYYRYDEECRCYLLYERGTDKLVGGRGDIPKKFRGKAIAEKWRD